MIKRLTCFYTKVWYAAKITCKQTELQSTQPCKEAGPQISLVGMSAGGIKETLIGEAAGFAKFVGQLKKGGRKRAIFGQKKR